TLARANIWQEFCLNIHRFGAVSVVLFKGGLATTVRDIPAGTLSDIGWFKGPLDSEYWEYQYRSAYSMGTKHSERYLFKVSMDYEVLGMHLPNGTWIKWDESVAANVNGISTGAIA
ncbi:hypothetical protein ACHAQA_002434, partial [Verticillium albo-atrum]